MTGSERVERRQQLSDEVADHVRDLIMSGQLREGDFIRQERIADDLDLSPTPVREGLLALRGEGFVQLKPRRGFVVAPLGGDDIRDLFMAQAMLAGELVCRAATNASDDDIAALRQVYDDTAKASEVGDVELVGRLHHDFHRRINRLAGSQRLAWMLSISTKFAPRTFFASVPGWAAVSADDHAAIITALLARDGEAARTAMMRHMANAGELLAGHFEAAQGAPSTH